MADKLTINAPHEVRTRHYSIEQRGGELELDLGVDVLAGAAEALARAVGEGISAVASKTGTLAAGIRAERQSDGSYAIVGPPGRLDPSTFNSPEAYARFREKLASEVPAIADPFADAAVESALSAALDGFVK